jgi:prepilin-type N-terminal cleavage/methylation domain-containing protein
MKSMGPCHTVPRLKGQDGERNLQGARLPGPDAGFSLMEVIVATVIATIAVVGLAYTFGLGRGFINRFEIGRAALGAAQGQLELIAAVPSNDTLVAMGRIHQSYLIVDGRRMGTEQWVLGWKDDPADGSFPADVDTSDLRIAVVTVLFQQGNVQDQVQLTRLLQVQ